MTSKSSPDQAVVDSVSPFTNIPGAAQRAGVSPRTIQGKLADGTLPYALLGRRVIIRITDIDEMIEARVRRRVRGRPTVDGCRGGSPGQRRGDREGNQ